ncbi:MAG: AMMECR1 domain-containing protein, partial [Candidatus Bathyarchaeota archaeon]
MSLSLEQGGLLVKFAREAIQSYLTKGEIISVPPDFPREFKVPRGVFVTLNKVLDDNRELRGCIG